MLLFLLSTFHKLTCQETPVCQKALVCQEAPVCLESPVCQDTLCFWNYDLSRHANLSRYSNRLRTLWSVKTLQLVKTKYTVQTICIGIWTFANCIWPFSCWLTAADMQMPKCKIPITYCKILIAYCKLLQTKWPNNISISSQFSYELDSIELHSCFGVSLNFWKSFHVFPHFQLKDVSIFRPASNPCLKLEDEPAWRAQCAMTLFFKDGSWIKNLNCFCAFQKQSCPIPYAKRGA